MIKVGFVKNDSENYVYLGWASEWPAQPCDSSLILLCDRSV